MRETSSRSSTRRVRLRDLTFQNSHCVLPRRTLVLLDAQELDGGADRGQRVAHFVGEHRQELVLAAIQVRQDLRLP